MRAGVQGPGAERLSVVGPDGVVAECAAESGLTCEATVDGPTWIAAVARGPGHPRTLDAAVLAHTSAVYVDVEHRRVARAGDARWCLDFLDTFEQFVAEHGRFAPDSRAARLGDLTAVVEQARSFYRRTAESAPR